MIQINNLSFGYSPKKLLYENINLSLEEGRIYGFLGKNGAGKTTLLQNIAGLLFPTSGKVLVNLKEPRFRKPSFLQNIYFIPEEIYVPNISVKQYIDLFGVFYPKFNFEQFINHTDELQVPNNQTISKLSLGQQKKFIIAFGLACNTNVLIMDEPTNGLDIPSKSIFRKLIAAALSENKTFIISTHQVRDLDNLIDEVVLIDKGEVLLKTSVYDITEKICFKTISTPDAEALYSENSLRGYDVLVENKNGEDSKLNLEQFFNAMLSNSSKMKEIFNTNSHLNN